MKYSNHTMYTCFRTRICYIISQCLVEFSLKHICQHVLCCQSICNSHAVHFNLQHYMSAQIFKALDLLCSWNLFSIVATSSICRYLTSGRNFWGSFWRLKWHIHHLNCMPSDHFVDDKRDIQNVYNSLNLLCWVLWNKYWLICQYTMFPDV